MGKVGEKRVDVKKQTFYAEGNVYYLSQLHKIRIREREWYPIWQNVGTVVSAMLTSVQNSITEDFHWSV